MTVFIENKQIGFVNLCWLFQFQETNVFHYPYSGFQLRNQAIFSKSIKLGQLFCDKNDVFRQRSFVLIKQSGLRKHHLIIALKIILPFINFIWLIDGCLVGLFIYSISLVES